VLREADLHEAGPQVLAAAGTSPPLADPTTDVAPTAIDSGPLACTHANGQLVHGVGSALEGVGVDTVAVRPSTGASVAGGTTRTGCGTPCTSVAAGWPAGLQVLAVFRPLPVLSAELDCIVEPPQDAAEHATLGLGSCPGRAWSPAALRVWHADVDRAGNPPS